MSKRYQAGSLGYDALWIPVFTGMIETINNTSFSVSFILEQKKILRCAQNDKFMSP
jgi:hypothetical protein